MPLELKYLPIFNMAYSQVPKLLVLLYFAMGYLRLLFPIITSVTSCTCILKHI